MAKRFDRMTLAELHGRHVRLKRELTSGGGSIFGAGTIMEITGKWKGLELRQVSKCSVCGCGQKRYLHRVDYHLVELLPIEGATDGE